MLADGRRVPIQDLVGTDAGGRRRRRAQPPHHRPQRQGVARRTSPRSSLVRLASGRTLRATADHRIRCWSGWQRVRELAAGDRVAIARRLPEPAVTERWPDDRVVLLGQLIGDGSYLSGQPLRYTTASEDNSRAVADAASARVRLARQPSRPQSGWHQLVLAGQRQPLGSRRDQPLAARAGHLRPALSPEARSRRRLPAAQ